MLEDMTIEEIIGYIDSLGGVVKLEPKPGDGTPEISWGDVFFFYAPDGVLPKSQPFATIVTKDYPDDQESRLDRSGVFRVNIAAGTAKFVEWTGRKPRESGADDADPMTSDVVIAHPVYGDLGWLAVVAPGTRTKTVILDLLRTAHDLARARYERRTELSG